MRTARSLIVSRSIWWWGGSLPTPPPECRTPRCRPPDANSPWCRSLPPPDVDPPRLWKYYLPATTVADGKDLCKKTATLTVRVNKALSHQRNLCANYVNSYLSTWIEVMRKSSNITPEDNACDHCMSLICAGNPFLIQVHTYNEAIPLILWLTVAWTGLWWLVFVVRRVRRTSSYFLLNHLAISAS